MSVRTSSAPFSMVSRTGRRSRNSLRTLLQRHARIPGRRQSQSVNVERRTDVRAPSARPGDRRRGAGSDAHVGDRLRVVARSGFRLEEPDFPARQRDVLTAAGWPRCRGSGAGRCGWRRRRGPAGFRAAVRSRDRRPRSGRPSSRPRSWRPTAVPRRRPGGAERLGHHREGELALLLDRRECVVLHIADRQREEEREEDVGHGSVLSGRRGGRWEVRAWKRYRAAADRRCGIGSAGWRQ